MSLRLSTATRNALITSSGLQSLFTRGVIKIYTGTQPASADSAPTGTHIATITTDGITFVHGEPYGGLEFTLTAAGRLDKKTGATWKLRGVASGTAGWFRLYRNTYDPGTTSTSYPRIDGSIPSNLTLTDLSINAATDRVVDLFYITLPSE
jgi:hypothetical protein